MQNLLDKYSLESLEDDIKYIKDFIKTHGEGSVYLYGAGSSTTMAFAPYLDI